MLHIIVGDKTRVLKYDSILESLRTSNPGISEKFFDANQGELNLFMESIQTNSMFGNRELIVLKRGEEAGNLSDLFSTLKLFNFNQKEIILDIEKKGNNFGKKAQKLAEEIGNLSLVKSKSEDETVIEFIKRKLNIDAKDAFKLKEMIGSNIQNVKNEIFKLQNYLEQEEFDIEKARKIITIKEEYNIFEVVDKLLKGNKKEALKYINSDGNTHLFLYNLEQEIKNILKLKILIKNNKINLTNNYNSFSNDFNQNKKYFKKSQGHMHPYAIFKKLDKVNKYSEEQLKNMLMLCNETEFKIKSGYSEDKIMLELLIMKI